MSVFRHEILVELDDGTEHKIVTDQRDMARWEVADDNDGGTTRDFTMMRHLAWTAMTRQGLTKAPWQEFNHKQCVEVNALRDEPVDDDSEGEQRLNPGDPVNTTGTPSSTSPSPAASHSAARRASKAGTRATSTP